MGFTACTVCAVPWLAMCSIWIYGVLGMCGPHGPCELFWGQLSWTIVVLLCLSAGLIWDFMFMHLSAGYVPPICDLSISDLGLGPQSLPDYVFLSRGWWGVHNGEFVKKDMVSFLYINVWVFILTLTFSILTFPPLVECSTTLSKPYFIKVTLLVPVVL